jgi:arginyl-tRNA synthetase
MSEAIYAAIQKALEALGAPDVAFVVERPGDLAHGDYATNAAMAAAKQLGKNPREVAEKLKAKLDEKIEGVEKIEIAGPGFINFRLSREAILQEVQKAATDEAWGQNNLYKDKTVMVEYTDPNPFKEFHIGHLMTNVIGESVAHTLENAGAKVIRANYQGDVGPHVAKGIFGLMELGITHPNSKELGEAYVLGASRYEESAEYKKRIDEINKAVYEKTDPQVNALYTIGREVSLEHFEELYRMLGTKFEHYFFESETSAKGLQLVADNTPGVFEKSDGAVVYKGEKVGLHTRVFVNSQGLPTYEAKDLGLLQLKKETAALDQSITVTAHEQSEYFKVMLAAAKEIPTLHDIAEKTTHITHGMMRFAQGKMSSRKGNVITGESLLMDLKDVAKEKMQGRDLPDTEKVAEQVAVGAIKYTVLKQGSGKDIAFDAEKSLSLEGDSGPYLQYAHTRAQSLIEKARTAGVSDKVESVQDITEFLHTLTLDRLLIHYPSVAARAAHELEPHYVTTYLTELSAAFNSWYAQVRVIDGDYPSYALLLAEAVEQTLGKGLQLLGIPVPKEM